MKKIAIIPLFLLVAQLTFGQSWQKIEPAQLDEAFKEMTQAYQSENYRFETRHQSFKGYHSETPHDDLSGFFVKSGSRYHASILGTEIYQDARSKLIIAHQHKEIQLHRPDRVGEEFMALAADFPELYKEITMLSRGDLREYRITYEEKAQLEQMHFTLNEQGFLKEMELYLRNPVTWQDEQGITRHTRPKVRITFEQLDTDFDPDPEEFAFEPYLTVKKKGYEPGLRSAGYQIKDMRLPVK